MRKILFLAANPKKTTRLRLDQELRDIQEGLERAKGRDDFRLIQKSAVRPRDIQRALLDETPQIVHFSGHGEGEDGLVFEDESGNARLVSGAALADLFALFASDIQCVLLNGCYSQEQAESIVEHIDYVIGMSQAINDRAAIEFAVAFYDALGAGRPYEFAYKLACAAIRLNTSAATGKKSSHKATPVNAPSNTDSSDSGEHLIPKLLTKPGLIEEIDIKQNSLESNLSAVEEAGQARLEIIERQIAEEEVKLQENLEENLKSALDWLKKTMEKLAQKSGNHAISHMPDIFEDTPTEKQGDFIWDIEKYIECVYYAILSNSYSLLDEPPIEPSVDDSEAYKTAFDYVKTKIPKRVGQEVIDLISNRLDYLLERIFIV